MVAPNPNTPVPDPSHVVSTGHEILAAHQVLKRSLFLCGEIAQADIPENEKPENWPATASAANDVLNEFKRFAVPYFQLMCEKPASISQKFTGLNTSFQADYEKVLQGGDPNLTLDSLKAIATAMDSDEMSLFNEHETLMTSFVKSGEDIRTITENMASDLNHPKVDPVHYGDLLSQLRSDISSAYSALNMSLTTLEIAEVTGPAGIVLDVIAVAGVAAFALDMSNLMGLLKNINELTEEISRLHYFNWAFTAMTGHLRELFSQFEEVLANQTGKMAFMAYENNRTSLLSNVQPMLGGGLPPEYARIQLAEIHSNLLDLSNSLNPTLNSMNHNSGKLSFGMSAKDVQNTVKNNESKSLVQYWQDKVQQ